MDGRDIRSLTTELDSTMRLVRELVREVQFGGTGEQLRGRLVDLAEHLSRRSDPGALPGLVLRAYAEVREALGEIQLGREAIHGSRFEWAGPSRLQSPQEGATESSSAAPLNGIDRSLALLDHVAADLPIAGPGRIALERLRQEMYELFGQLQVRDLAAQQLAGVDALLEAIENRMRGVAVLFDRPAAPVMAESGHASLNGNAIGAAFAVRSPIPPSTGSH